MFGNKEDKRKSGLTDKDIELAKILPHCDFLNYLEKKAIFGWDVADAENLRVKSMEMALQTIVVQGYRKLTTSEALEKADEIYAYLTKDIKK